MAAAALCITAIIAILAFVIIRINRADEISDEIAHGDCPFIPEGMAATRKVRGGETASSSGRLQQDVIARRHGSGL